MKSRVACILALCVACSMVYAEKASSSIDGLTFVAQRTVPQNVRETGDNSPDAVAKRRRQFEQERQQRAAAFEAERQRKAAEFERQRQERIAQSAKEPKKSHVIASPPPMQNRKN